jgi:hypothetical protein
MIRKLSNGQYRIYSRKKDSRTGKRRNLGTFRTREGAERHERAIQSSSEVDLRPSTLRQSASRRAPITNSRHERPEGSDLLSPGPKGPTRKGRVGRRHVVDETDRLIGVVTLNSLARRAPKEQDALEVAQKISRRSARTA